jgi:predicted transposase YbfD/YdcC
VGPRPADRADDRLGSTRRPPAYGTFQGLFARLDAPAFEAAVARWVDRLLPAAAADELRAVALDGKTARGGGTAVAPAVHLLAALDQPTGGVRAQARVPADTNAHKAALALLEGMVREGRVVTGDAAFCPRDLGRQVVGAGGHYLLKVDDNQPTRKADIATAFGPSFSPYGRRKAAAQADEATTWDKHGGRIERRRLRITTMLNGDLDGPAVAQVGRLERTVTAGGEVTPEVQDLITSVPRERAGAAALLGWARGHWGIENRLHYVRDVTRGEEANRTRSGSGPPVLAALRNLAVTRLRLSGVTNIAGARRRNAARVRDLLVNLCILKN